MSSAFDTIEHTVSLRGLEDKFVFCRTAVEWVRSYLSGRLQQVVIDGATFGKFDIGFGVPQGSCLVPLLFSICRSQLCHIVSQHLPTVHCYADDTQLHLAFRPGDRATQDSAVGTMEACIRDVREWMIKYKLRINDDKSEFVLISTQVKVKKVDIENLAVESLVYPPVQRQLETWMRGLMPTLQSAHI